MKLGDNKEERVLDNIFRVFHHNPDTIEINIWNSTYFIEFKQYVLILSPINSSYLLTRLYNEINR